jgi:hypothetical protein
MIIFPIMVASVVERLTGSFKRVPNHERQKLQAVEEAG